MVQTIFLLCAALSVAGCAHEARWIRADNAAADSSLDQKACGNEAARSAMLNRNAGSMEPGNTQYDHFRHCMRARGYQYTRVK